MKSTKSAITFLFMFLIIAAFTSCSAGKKTGCPGAITSKEVRKTPA